MSKNEQARYRDDIIRAQMAAMGMTSEKLAELADVSVYTVSQARNGKEITVKSLSKIVPHLRLTMKDVFDFDATVPEIIGGREVETVGV